MRIYSLTVAGALLISQELGNFCLGQEHLKIDNTPQEKKQNLQPADVLVHLGLLQDALECLRVYMGGEENRQSPIRAKGAAPREVYFAALTLFRKADRLCFEHTRERTQQPGDPKRNIRPDDVHAMVDAALTCVQRVETRYGIDRRSTLRQRDPEKLPTDVLKAIVQANRQLNLMLEQRFAPSDVFQQVTLGVGYTSRLLEVFPEATRIPDEPEFEPGKRPADVYRRLLKCFQRIRRIAELSHVKMLDLEVDEGQIEEAAPSDVYDIASLIVAELAHLHAQIPDSKAPRKVYFVGRKFPSHVFQRAGILERQLIDLEEWVERNPDWLEPKHIEE